ncbi:MAG TPA: DUF1015 domain-containing protein [Bacteroidia bacterium]|jgi:uncharacterized protein (DUF1015 family)|nr:DUF1015 domain-containing protein [Bacteroidia bacterium]
MATVIPFKGIRPTRDKVGLVASRSVDNYSKNDLHEKLKSNPFTFLHVIHPDFKDGRRTKPGSMERLKKVKAQYESFQREGIFTHDEKPCYYVYRQIKSGNTFTGIIACTSIEDYMNGTIRIHEQTLTEREKKLMEYLEVCDFNAEPVLFCYPDQKDIDTIIAAKTAERAEYDFTTTDRVHHMLWVIDDAKQVNELQKHFAGVPSVYIADGHHRSASSTLLGRSRREKHPEFTGKEPWNFYLGVFFPESQLKIFDFNRVVRDLNGLTEIQFLDALKENFEIRDHDKKIFIPHAKHIFSMYLDGKWYELRMKNGRAKDEEPVQSLDAHLLTELILAPVLGISDLKTDPRIGFVSGIKGAEELRNQVDHWKFKVAFGLCPVQMDELKRIADSGNIMPPKTTWIEPKMRSGLVIYPLSD